ncbi:hypothetical protein EHQ12_03160 [Leptospira gomenensis]|uniref:Uncharacterized protein n=1 Tax=Leptospira gomenensis TaxID=2484974 RepID=A0A5F1Z132_9LEPT|nr:hypothetical protein EHQ17_15195 [Leptospira gomenensis]TGK43393.1 hypothetical protein EHQ12_03160 [Leptospira gomenensis]TGK45413.1 hypothetical protein EHQ07_09805 [Leptospira gomenensis]TGK66280.1 hypothetical protein EHQ13_03540 [Leptospira gomenensis]
MAVVGITTTLFVLSLGSQPKLGNCKLFPENNVWNVPVDRLPVHPRSQNYVQSIGTKEKLKADFGSGLWEGKPIGIPFLLADEKSVPTGKTYPVKFEYVEESDPGPYPIPPNAPVEGGETSDGDRHVLVVTETSCKLYELYDARFRTNTQSWTAGSGAIFDLNSNLLRPSGWTSADAAGLPILPGLVRYEEIEAGEITHAIRFTAKRTQKAFVWPARHFASKIKDPNVPPMGARFRLKADFKIEGFSEKNQVILRALKKYGMILADNGANWFLSGSPDERWNNDDLHQLRKITGDRFEVVDSDVLMVSSDSGETKQN